MLRNNFKSVYSPGEKLVVDESLVPFRGRILFRQYIPGKSHKYGIKLYKICTVIGYAWDLQVYTGNLSNEPEHNIYGPQTGKASSQKWCNHIRR